MKNDPCPLSDFLEALFQRYGYDFRNYSQASLRRRIEHFMKMNDFSSIATMAPEVLNDSALADNLFKKLSINVTEMFRDPAFFLALRQQLLPQLKPQQHCKIWHAGCASGEEAYSMAILLNEEGLTEHYQLYATDFNQAILAKAKLGIFPIDRMRTNIYNYITAGGKAQFSDYYQARFDGAAMANSLKKSIHFAQHDLCIDSGFGEMQVVICRNVLIYFNRELQNRVLQLFYDNLSTGGFLCLGSHESLRFSPVARLFETINSHQRIYRKLR